MLLIQTREICLFKGKDLLPHSKVSRGRETTLEGEDEQKRVDVVQGLQILPARPPNRTCHLSSKFQNQKGNNRLLQTDLSLQRV